VRVSLERFARRWWDGELGLGGTLLRGAITPVSWAWRGAAALDGARRARGAVAVPGVAVVSVGNLAVGGTGKTPLTGWVVERVAERGARAAVLVGAAARDEARLHRLRLPGVTVIEGGDRVDAAKAAAAGGARVIVLDDGFQHRRLARDFDVVLLSAEDRFPGGAIPSGPYREGPRALARADAVLVTRRVASAARARALAERADEYAPGRVLGGVWIDAGRWCDLNGDPTRAPEGDLVAACAIARPSAFMSAVTTRASASVELVAFPDHHEYTPGDVARLAGRGKDRPLVITEKDAVKLRNHADTLGEAYVLCEDVRWDWGENGFLTQLLTSVTDLGA
jgi:tetraacyldisaccharide 4'-kinase